MEKSGWHLRTYPPANKISLITLYHYSLSASNEFLLRVKLKLSTCILIHCFLIHDISTTDVLLMYSPHVAVPSLAKLKQKWGKFYKKFGTYCILWSHSLVRKYIVVFNWLNLPSWPLDEINIAEEEKVYEAIMTWVKNDLPSKECLFLELLEQVR